MKRVGLVGKLKPEMVDTYVKLHAAVWPSVLQRIEACHIRNYSIFLKQLPGRQFFLFSYFEYVGAQFDEDMRQMAADPEVQRWWAECKPCFQRLEELPPDEVWAPMQEIFYFDG